MLVTLRKVSERLGEKRIQVNVPENYEEVNMKPSYLNGLDMSDSTNVYGTANFKFKGDFDDAGRKIFDFNGYQN